MELILSSTTGFAVACIKNGGNNNEDDADGDQYKNKIRQCILEFAVAGTGASLHLVVSVKENIKCCKKLQQLTGCLSCSTSAIKSVHEDGKITECSCSPLS